MIRLLGGSKIGVSIALVAILLAVVVSSGAIAASSSQPLFARAMHDPDFRMLMMELRTEGYEIEIRAVQQNSEVHVLTENDMVIQVLEYSFDDGVLLYGEIEGVDEQPLAMVHLLDRQETWVAHDGSLEKIEHANLIALGAESELGMLTDQDLVDCIQAYNAGALVFCALIGAWGYWPGVVCAVWFHYFGDAQAACECALYGIGCPDNGGGGGGGGDNGANSLCTFGARCP